MKKCHLGFQLVLLASIIQDDFVVRERGREIGKPHRIMARLALLRLIWESTQRALKEVHRHNYIPSACCRSALMSPLAHWPRQRQMRELFFPCRGWLIRYCQFHAMDRQCYKRQQITVLKQRLSQAQPRATLLHISCCRMRMRARVRLADSCTPIKLGINDFALRQSSDMTMNYDTRAPVAILDHKLGYFACLSDFFGCKHFS